MEHFEVSCVGEARALGEWGRAVRSVKEATKSTEGGWAFRRDLTGGSREIKTHA